MSASEQSVEHLGQMAISDPERAELEDKTDTETKQKVRESPQLTAEDSHSTSETAPRCIGERSVKCGWPNESSHRYRHPDNM